MFDRKPVINIIHSRDQLVIIRIKNVLHFKSTKVFDNSILSTYSPYKPLIAEIKMKTIYEKKKKLTNYIKKKHFLI